jgi:DNA gyrase subunit B
MPGLVEGGHLYIAQPPLYRVKKGKSERYLKDESAMQAYFAQSAEESVKVWAHTGDVPAEIEDVRLAPEQVRELMGLCRDWKRKTERMRRYPTMLVDAFYFACDGVLEGRNLAEVGEAIRKRVLSVEDRMRVLSVEHGSDPEPWIELTTELRGDRSTVRLTSHLGENQALTELNDKLKALVPLPAGVKAGNVEKVAENWADLLQHVLELAQRGYDVQRYKGLGEMNPEQLWETTMDPTARTLQKVELNNPLDADVMFTTLMGDAVEPRRQFIEDNALTVRNLDV